MITGLLLAAGRGTRFTAAHKLLHPLKDGTPMALAALRNLAPCVDQTIVVLRPEDSALHAALQNEDVRFVRCKEAQQGFGASIACGVRAAANADGWLIALADMPFISTEVIRNVASQLSNGAALVAPQYQTQRGHPVGFGKIHYNALSLLSNDEGARQIVDEHKSGLVLIDCNDPGVLRDIDTLDDLA